MNEFSEIENEIPHDLPIPRSTPALQVVYMLTMSANTTSKKGSLGLSFVKQSAETTDSDGWFEIHVYDSCRVTLNLDPYWNWRFNTENDLGPVTLGTHDDPQPTQSANTRYWDLEFAKDGSSASFSALRFAPSPQEDQENRDPINLHIQLALTMPDTTTEYVSITIDPDIRNPGDPPDLVVQNEKK